MQISKHVSAGFTLIEILVVIAILSILIGIGTYTFTFAVKKAQLARVQADFATMQKIIESRRITEGKTLGELTGNWCSICQCDPGHREVPVGTKALDPSCLNVVNASWTNLSGQPMPRDPWGNPYSMDENEGEYAFPNNCRGDSLVSAGPDGMFGSAANDDIGYSLSLSSFCQ